MSSFLWPVKTPSCDVVVVYYQHFFPRDKFIRQFISNHANPRNIRDITSSNPRNSGMLHLKK